MADDIWCDPKFVGMKGEMEFLAVAHEEMATRTSRGQKFPETTRALRDRAGRIDSRRPSAEEGDKWENRRPQVTSSDRRTEPRQDDDDEGRMVLHDVGESNWALNSGSVEASYRLTE